MTPTPRTAAGRALLDDVAPSPSPEHDEFSAVILAIEAQAAAPDALREALDTANKELLSDEMSDLSGDHLYSRRMAFIRSVRAALVAPTAPAGPPCAFCDSPNGKKWHRLSCIEVRSAAPATLPAIDTRIVWKRDHGMVIVTGDEEPQSLEIPAWAVRTIFDVAGKDPEEEARKVSALINAHTGPATLPAIPDAGQLALEWMETTHGNEFGHDHHCPLPTNYEKGGWVGDAGDPEVCTCGWSAFRVAYDARQKASLRAERSDAEER